MKGALFLLEVEIDSVFTVLAAMRTTTMTVNNETVDVTSKGDLQRELLENCGIQSVSVKAQGCISSADSYKKISYAANTGEILNVKINSNNGEIYSGGFILSAFETSGEYNKDGLYSITLESADTVRLIDNNFILLEDVEDGGFLLLEDGFKFVLEAA